MRRWRVERDVFLLFHELEIGSEWNEATIDNDTTHAMLCFSLTP